MTAERLVAAARLAGVIGLLAAAVASRAEPASSRPFDAGCLASRDTDARGNARLRVLGPFFERRTAPDGASFLAVRPFYSEERDAAGERVQRQFLWPVCEVRDLRGERSWHCLTAFGNDYDTATRGSRFRVVVIPFLAAGRDRNGEEYFGVFPLAGRFNEFLSFDSFVFVLFPLYVRAQVNDVVTRGVLWPVFEDTRGQGVRRFRVFPFYGRAVNEGRQEAAFVMWPVWTHARFRYRGGEGFGYAVFPLFGYARVKDGRTWMALPPLFRYTVSDDVRLLHCPWPFVRYRSDDPRTLYLWPLWGRRSQAGMDRACVLWPVCFIDRHERPEYVVRRFLLNPLIHAETRRGKAAGAEQADPYLKYFRLWPLFSYRREHDAAAVRALELWPTKDMRAVDKNLAPFWTVATWEREGAARAHELLWGLYRYRNDGAGGRAWSLFPLLNVARETDGDGARACELLRGLLGYRREGLRKELRLLYFARVHCDDH